jgi:hypothetical protein
MAIDLGSTQLIGQALNFLQVKPIRKTTKGSLPNSHGLSSSSPCKTAIWMGVHPPKNKTKPTRRTHQTLPHPSFSNSKRVNIRHVGLSEHRCIISVPINIAINWGYTAFSDTYMMVYTSYTHTNIPCCIAIILLYVYIYIYYMYMYVYIYIMISHASDWTGKGLISHIICNVYIDICTKYRYIVVYMSTFYLNMWTI